MTANKKDGLLEVQSLSVQFGSKQAVKDASFTLHKGEILAIVGESGSGKSSIALSILQLLPYPLASHSAETHIRFDDSALCGAEEKLLRQIRGKRIGMIFQEPMTALNPLHSIYKQIAEIIYTHQSVSKSALRGKILSLLEEVGLSHLKDRLHALPHQLSGGERQRVMIAMAIANDPELLIADEPTTALDVTVQVQILALIKRLQEKKRMAVLLITHDLTLVRRMADRVSVMRHGEIVESGTAEQILHSPQHAYTKELLAAEPKGEAVPLPTLGGPLLQTDALSVSYPVNAPLFPWNRRYTDALKSAHIKLYPGQTLGIVGESGSGKSTLGLAILRLIKSNGEIFFHDKRLDVLGLDAMRPLRKQIQFVSQDPFSSLNPRISVGEILSEGLHVHNIPNAQQKISHILREVGLPEDAANRYPHEFSGGERQRISIARAMILEPVLVVLDEPTSALDLSVQAQIIALLKRFQLKFGTSYLFISHDLRVVKAISHYSIVMKRGEIIEQNSTHSLFNHPQTDYTKALINAAFPECSEQGNKYA